MAKRSRKFLQVQEQPNEMWADHPFNDKENHERLLCYIKDRINLSLETIDTLRDRFESIDKKLAGFLRLDENDRQRELDNRKGKAPKPVKAKPQLALAQLGRGVTYLASVFSPDTGVYEALTTADEQTYANAVVELMNKQSIKAKYFREQCKFFLNNLKYNIAGLNVEWCVQNGYTVGDDAGKAVAKPGIVYQGNYCKSVPMYNTFWDTAVHPTEVHSKGEFAGTFEMLTPFRVKALVENGELFNVSELLEDGRGSVPDRSNEWFRSIPDVRFQEGTASLNASGNINWEKVMTARAISGYSGSGGMELTTICIWLLPNDFGLANPRERKARKKLEIWKICILNGQKICYTERLNNIHNYLPYFFSTPNEDDLGLDQMSVGETLIPFNELGAFMYNTFVDSTRKNIWDMIVYDPSVIDFAAIGDDVAARIPIKSAGWGKDLRQSIWTPNKPLNTDKMIPQIKELLELMEYVFPTRMLQQVADMERAVKDQVAAVVQASQRESWKLAKIIDDQCMSPARFVMYSNVLQFQQTIKVLMPDGTTIELDPTKLRSMELEYKIAEGLQTIDKLQKQLWLKEVLNMILQSGGPSEDLNMPKLMSAVSRMWGVQLDLAQFAYTPDELRQRAAAKSVGQAAGGIVQDAANNATQARQAQ